MQWWSCWISHATYSTPEVKYGSTSFSGKIFFELNVIQLMLDPWILLIFTSLLVKFTGHCLNSWIRRKSAGMVVKAAAMSSSNMDLENMKWNVSMTTSTDVARAGAPSARSTSTKWTTTFPTMRISFCPTRLSQHLRLRWGMFNFCHNFQMLI